MATTGDVVKCVQVDAHVILKVVKHYHDECGLGNEVVQGVLLGLNVDGRLEITNCFGYPQRGDGEKEDDYNEANVVYATSMMKSYRQVNLDYLNVGWYQTVSGGALLTVEFLDSQFNYQNAIDESVALVYDPVKSAKGQLSVRAYRLAPALFALQQHVQARRLYFERSGQAVPKSEQISFEEMKQFAVRFEKLLVEVPVIVHQSPLQTVLSLSLCPSAVQPRAAPAAGQSMGLTRSTVGDSQTALFGALDLQAAGGLERTLKAAMAAVDDVCSSKSKLTATEKAYARGQAQILKKHNEAFGKAARVGELSTLGAGGLTFDEEMAAHDTATRLPLATYMDMQATCGQLGVYCRGVQETCTALLGKLFVAESVQQAQSDSA